MFSVMTVFISYSLFGHKSIFIRWLEWASFELAYVSENWDDETMYLPMRSIELYKLCMGCIVLVQSYTAINQMGLSSDTRRYLVAYSWIQHWNMLKKSLCLLCWRACGEERKLEEVRFGNKWRTLRGEKTQPLISSWDIVEVSPFHCL